MGLPIPIPSAPPLRALPSIRPNPLVSVPSGISQMVAPPARVLMQLPPRLPPLNLAPIANGFRVASAIALPVAIVDLIGQAGAYKWRDNLLDQIIGGNSTKSLGEPPFKGGQISGAAYLIFADRLLSDNTWRLNSYTGVVLSGKILELKLIDNDEALYVRNEQGSVSTRYAGSMEFGATKLRNLYARNSEYGTTPDGYKADSGGDLQGLEIGGLATNPFVVPPIETDDPPFILPNPLSVNNPLPNKNPLPLNNPLPNKNPLPNNKPLPLINPFPDSNPSPLINPLPDFNPSPNKNPFVNPSSVPLRRPIDILEPITPIIDIINNQINANKINNDQVNQAEQIKEKNRIRRREDCCCQDNDQDNQDKELEVYAAVPLWWQIMPEGNRPQLVLQFGIKENGKIKAPKYPITLPHPRSNQKPLSPLLDSYFKGNWEGRLTLADNSKLIVNCKDREEVIRVVNTLKPFINPNMLKGAKLSISERTSDEPIKEQMVYARIATYFPQGIKDSDDFAWRVKFNV